MSKSNVEWPANNALSPPESDKNTKKIEKNTKKTNLKMCQHNSSMIFRNYLYSAFIIGFVIPVGIITYCYSKIVYTMNAVHRRAQAHQTDVRKSANSNASRK